MILKVEKGLPRELGEERRGGEGEDGRAEGEGKEGAGRLVSAVSIDFTIIGSASFPLMLKSPSLVRSRDGNLFKNRPRASTSSP